MSTKLTRNDPVVFHFRKGRGKQMTPKGGATVVFLPEVARFGIAICCGKDRYNRKVGRTIAAARAESGRFIRPGGRRFNPAPLYTGPLTMEDVKKTAIGLSVCAMAAVDNKLVDHIETGYVEGTKSS